MAVTAAADVAVLGNGTRSQVAYESVGRVVPTIFRFMPAIPLPQGWASHTFPTWGASINAAAASENATALTPQTLGTPGSLALTPSGVRAAMGGSSEAFNRVLPENDLYMRYEFELRNAMARYFAYDTSVGVVNALFDTITESGGSGAATVSGILDRALAVRTALGDASVHLIAWLDLKGADDLDDDIRSAGGTAFGNAATSEEIRGILYKNGFDEGTDGYRITLSGNTHVFVDPNPGALKQSGGNRIGCIFVPHLPGLNGIPIGTTADPLTKNIAPAFGMAFRPDPVLAAKVGFVKDPIYGEDDAGRYVIVPRAYAGVNQGIVDAWRMGATGVINQASASEYLYTI